MPDNSKTLTKLIIHSFDKNDFREETSTFTTPINPETFTKTSHIELDTGRAHGQAGANPIYKSTAPEELKIEFVLDGTKTMEGYLDKYKDMDVTAQIKSFTDCVYKYKKNIHRPMFLIILWGSDVKFPCVLSNMDINYSLFKPNGDPLRAKITANFIKYESKEAIAAVNRPSSPDLTHYKKVNEGDRLDLLTYKVYNNSKYFLQVGKVNDLTSLRKLKPGIQLYLPPLDKT